jgi:tetratricopeptide (TPR) repeat protein
VAKKKKRRDRKKKKPVPSLPSGVAAALREAGSLMRQGRAAKAAELLSQADRRHPNNPTLLAALLDAYHQMRDFAGYLDVIIRLQALRPDNPNRLLMLAAAYLVNGYPALSLRAYEQFLERWPDRPEAEIARPEAAKVRAVLEEHPFPGLEASGAEGRELAVLNEQVLLYLSQGKLSQTREAAARLLERRPDFVPAWNNTAEVLIREGHFAEAAEACGRVLALQPDNFFALSNLTRCQYLSGRLDEAWATAGRLKAVTSSAGDIWVKKAEALSYLGDDAGVLEAWRGAMAAGLDGPPMQYGLLLHLAAVAHYRQGQENEARRLWQNALRHWPGMDEAARNLDDLRKPAGQRHAAWPFAFHYWVTREAMDALVAHVDRVQKGGKNDEGITAEVRRCLEEHPEIGRLVPALLDRGDPGGRLFALRLALMAKTPDLLAALRDFALSQRGPDDLRVRASAAATEADLIPSGPVRMWMQGEWREVLMLGFQVHWDADEPVADDIQELGRQGFEAMEDRDAARAEQFFRQALALHPEDRSMQFNLASVCRLQGREAEADAIVQRLHERDPDYLFARTYLANKYTREGQYDKAREILKPLLSRKRLHVSELSALCAAEFEWALAQGLRDGARQWLDMLAKCRPEDPNVLTMRTRLEAKSGWRRMLGW